MVFVKRWYAFGIPVFQNQGSILLIDKAMERQYSKSKAKQVLAIIFLWVLAIAILYIVYIKIKLLANL